MMSLGHGRPTWELIRKAADTSARTRFALAAFLTIMTSALTALAPLVLTRFVDSFAGGGVIAASWALVIMYVAMIGAGRAIDIVQGYAFATADQRLQRSFAGAAFQHLLRLPLRAHLDHQAGSLVQTQALALQGVRMLLTQTALVLGPAAIQMCIIIAVVFAELDGVFWGVVAVSIVAYVAVFWWSVTRLARPLRDALDANVASAGLRADGLGNIEAVKSATAEERIGDRFEKLLAREEGAWRSVHGRRVETGLAVAFILVASLGSALVIGTDALAGGRISLGGFLLLNTYLLQIVRPLETAGFAIRDVGQGLAYLARWAEIQRMPSEFGNAGGETSSADQRSGSRVEPPAIRFENVSFGYDDGKPILAGVDFHVAPGSVVAIVGPSGAGKSTLLRLLFGHYWPASGRILVGETAVSPETMWALRRSIAVVSQDVVLFNDTLRYNLQFARPDADANTVQRVLVASGLTELVARLPPGLETRVGERGLKLSGGEKQRVALARALLQDAPVLILDEATSALDVDTERRICGDLLQAARGRTTLIVTHRLALASSADMILVLSDGRIVERGPHAELVRGAGLYASMWRSQASTREGLGSAPVAQPAGDCSLRLGGTATARGNDASATILQVQEWKGSEHD